MPLTNGHDEHYAILRQSIHFDTQKRFEILREEIEHFISSVEFRTGARENVTASVQPASEEMSSPAPNSQSAFLKRLAESAYQLRHECHSDLREINEFEATWLEDHQAIAAASRGGEEAQASLDLHDGFAIVWNSKLHEKAIVIAERLGDLHDRLEQFLQRTNPDHPDPTLRRRSEQGLTDKYLCEFTRWVHRDIALFAISAGANYPYGEVPSTYQSWAYDRTSRQHAFMTLESHINWKRQTESGDKSTKIDKPQKFTAISLSYWIPERPSLVPIIGHELAHQVLRDLYGRELNFPTLETDESEVGRVVRRLTNAVEAWLAPRFRAGQTEPKISSYLVQEIMCDCLAAVRFGYGYAYAWILETISDDRFAKLFHDEYGMLRRYARRVPPQENAQLPTTPEDSAVSTDLKRLQDEAMLNARRLQMGTFNQYYRGIVLAKLLQQLGLETDPFSQGLQLAFEKFLRLMLQLYTLGDTQRAAYETEMARDLASNLVDEWLIDDAADGYGNSDFVKKARTLWEIQAGRTALSSPSLRHQQLNNTYRRLVAEAVEQHCGKYKLADIPSLSAVTDPRSVQTLTDLTWRLEWLVESMKLQASRGTVEEKSIDILRGAIRALNFIGMDDYLVRTANPIRLFSVLVDRSETTAVRVLTAASENTNTLDGKRLEQVYGDGPLKELDRAVLSGVKPILVHVASERVALDPALIKWIVNPLMNPNLWQELILGPSPGSGLTGQYMMELLRVRGSDGALGTDMRIQQRSPQLPQVHSKYQAKCSAALLGRYDAMVLHEQVHKDGQIGWEVSTERNGMRHLKRAETVSRAKRIVRIHGSTPAKEINDDLPLVAVALVSLKWDASRPLVAKWLATAGILDETNELRIDAFLSDGWEDLVLLASLGGYSQQNGEQAGQQSQQYVNCARALVKLVQRLNSNPFVVGTETLLTRHILGHAPPEFQFRFAFRVAEQGYVMARKILNTICQPYGLKLQEVAGNKDFELIVPSDKNSIVGELHRTFHRHADSNYRVETRTAWTIPEA
jgi:hypothetical protein